MATITSGYDTQGDQAQESHSPTFQKLGKNERCVKDPRIVRSSNPLSMSRSTTDRWRTETIKKQKALPATPTKCQRKGRPSTKLCLRAAPRAANTVKLLRKIR
mmetsp:Transcript_3056/g.7206  ORF Transcript_3056/g.7206 Transcript_3056/m.7206 type:complete len:103 (+) Transcript_3056:2176-2484(+)